jgi:hypothetical protein
MTLAQVRRGLRVRWRSTFVVTGLVLAVCWMYLAWPSPSLPLVGEINGLQSSAYPMTFSTDGRRLLAGDKERAIWGNIATGRLGAEWSSLQGGHTRQALVSPDGRSLIVTTTGPTGPSPGPSVNYVAVLDAETLQERLIFSVPGGIWSPRLSADGSTLRTLIMTSNVPNPLEFGVYDLATGTEQSRQALPI